MNYDKISDLSLADLVSLYNNYVIMYSSKQENSYVILSNARFEVVEKEIHDRLNKIKW